MHERDLQQRPEWSQKVVNAMVKAQLWTRDNRAETAALLSKEGVNKYMPHSTAVLEKELSPPASDNTGYVRSGAIRNAAWLERRIDFHPYPYASYTEELVRRLKTTLIEGDHAFLNNLNPAAAARELVDDSFVKKAILAAGGLKAFGLPDDFARQEVIVA
jgi:NitT/TauT family transport system substrate-binding protein